MKKEKSVIYDEPVKKICECGRTFLSKTFEMNHCRNCNITEYNRENKKWDIKKNPEKHNQYCKDWQMRNRRFIVYDFLEHEIGEDKYVGSTVNLYNREKHHRLCKRSEFENQGVDMIKVLDVTDILNEMYPDKSDKFKRGKLRQLEHYFIYSLQPKLNIVNKRTKPVVCEFTGKVLDMLETGELKYQYYNIELNMRVAM